MGQKLDTGNGLVGKGIELNLMLKFKFSACCYHLLGLFYTPSITDISHCGSNLRHHMTGFHVTTVAFFYNGC